MGVGKYVDARSTMEAWSRCSPAEQVTTESSFFAGSAQRVDKKAQRVSRSQKMILII